MIDPTMTYLATIGLGVNFRPQIIKGFFLENRNPMGVIAVVDKDENLLYVGRIGKDIVGGLRQRVEDLFASQQETGSIAKARPILYQRLSEEKTLRVFIIKTESKDSQSVIYNELKKSSVVA